MGAELVTQYKTQARHNLNEDLNKARRLAAWSQASGYLT